ncbi:hypothetical protein V8C44DRAFT_338005 [Trichoderma aethiopicum]
MIRLLRPGPIGRVKAWRESVAMSLSRFVDWPCRACLPPPLSIQCTYTETTRTKGSALITSYEGCSRRHAPMREMTESHWPQKAIEDAAPGLSYSCSIKEGEQPQEGSSGRKKTKKQKQSNNSPWTKKSNKKSL